jgi:hypothetical protein
MIVSIYADFSCFLYIHTAVIYVLLSYSKSKVAESLKCPVN